MTTNVTPHRVYDAERRVPPLGPYLISAAAHLPFAYEKARFDLKASHRDTWFGRIWNVLNPLLLGAVYWLLVVVIFGDGGSIFDRAGLQTLTRILAGLYLFGLFSASLSQGARSIVAGGAFVLNTRLPRIILPIGSVIASVLTFGSSIVVYGAFHLAAGYPVGLVTFWAIPIVVLVLGVAVGLTILLATLTVYFRDVASFLPFVLRIWLYLTPVIYLYDAIPARLGWTLYVNPVGSLFAAWQQVLLEGQSPEPVLLLGGLLWAAAVILIGGMAFLRREFDFAVRI